jgi:hypothetical protein
MAVKAALADMEALDFMAASEVMAVMAAMAAPLETEARAAMPAQAGPAATQPAAMFSLQMPHPFSRGRRPTPARRREAWQAAPGRLATEAPRERQGQEAQPDKAEQHLEPASPARMDKKAPMAMGGRRVLPDGSPCLLLQDLQRIIRFQAPLRYWPTPRRSLALSAQP